MNLCHKSAEISRAGVALCPAPALIFPLVFPLQIQNVLYKALHALGAVLSHAFGHVPIAVQRESCGSVPKIALDAFRIIPGPEGVYRKSVPICYNKDKSGNPLKIKEDRTCPYSFSNHIPSKIRPLKP